MGISPFCASDEYVKAVVADEEYFIIFIWYSVAKWRTVIAIIRLHPETQGKLCQIRHSPDVDAVSHIVFWELESIVCGTVKYKLEWNEPLKQDALTN